MTVEAIIRIADTLRPNTTDADTKLLWISTLEKSIFEHMTRYGEADIKKAKLTPESPTLLGDEYAYMYAYYAVAMIDLANQDIAMYNNSSTFFNDMFESWQKKWRREHMPQSDKGGDC